MDGIKILIAVIAYNEEKNIRLTLSELMEHNFGFDIVVIDNGSCDRTKQICKELGIDVISHCINTGSSFGTVMTYFLYAYQNNYDILCQFDGDGQHIASELPQIIEPIRNDNVDYVIGSRFLEKKGFQSYFFRRIGIRLFAYISSKCIDYTVTDVTSGFRAYGKRVIKFFAKDYKHEMYDTSQLLLLSHFSGAKIKEVPVKMQERKFGKSEFNFLNAVTFPVKGIINIAGSLLQKKRIKQMVGNNYGD